MKTLNDYKVGDILKITSRSKLGEEQRTAIVVHLNYEGSGLVGVQGIRISKDMLETGSGAFDPTTVGTKPFGFYCAVEKIGHKKPTFCHSWSPKPGDRSYDLMH